MVTGKFNNVSSCFLWSFITTCHKIVFSSGFLFVLSIFAAPVERAEKLVTGAKRGKTCNRCQARENM